MEKVYKLVFRCSQWLSVYTSWFIIAVALVAEFVPVLFSWVHGSTQSIILGFIMLTMGLTLTIDDIVALASRPLDILIGVCAQYGIMPLVAWLLPVGLGYVGVAVPKPIIVGIILVGCSPGGVSSNIMSYLCRGDVAFSVGMTTASTLLAPVVTPLLVLWLAGHQVAVDTIGMFLNILFVTLIPVTVGFFCNIVWGEERLFKRVQAVMPGFSVIGLACIVGGVVATVHSKLLIQGMSFFLLVLLIVLAHNGLGYLLGYSVGSACKFSKAKKRTVSIEVGMQNAGLATVLASSFFAATCPLAVVPCAVSCVWHSISGTMLANYFRHKDDRKMKSDN